MDEIIKRVADAAGLDEAVARKAVGIVLDLVAKEAPPDTVDRLFAALAGSESLAAEGAVGGIGLFGALGGNLAAAYGKLTKAGLSSDQMRAAGEELFVCARETAGKELVDEVIKSIPGLTKLV